MNRTVSVIYLEDFVVTRHTKYRHHKSLSQIKKSWILFSCSLLAHSVTLYTTKKTESDKCETCDCKESAEHVLVGFRKRGEH